MGGDTECNGTFTITAPVSIAGGDSWVGIPCTRRYSWRVVFCFNRRWRFLGGDTRHEDTAHCDTWFVSIAGGDSWVGIPIAGGDDYLTPMVSIAGGDSWVGIHFGGGHENETRVCFNRRWRFLGGDTTRRQCAGGANQQVSIAGGDSWVGIPCAAARGRLSVNSFNRRWRFLGGDTIAGKSANVIADTGFNRRWRFLGGDTDQLQFADNR